MAFIDKKDPIVLNIKLTSKGRELLSRGQLNFSYFAIGDSEIDYEFNKNAIIADPLNFNPSNASILRPADKNPCLLSFITKDFSGDTHNVINSVPSTQTVIENDVSPLGFFQVTSGGSASFITDSDHVKQPDIMIYISGVTGETTLKLNQAPTYLANPNEPVVGDLILIRWTNPNGVDTTGYTINMDYPTPNIFYKISEIVSGSLAADNMVVKVDRPLPNFNGSGTTLAGALVYYNYINYTGDTCYETDYTDDATLAFLQNCQCPTVRFPFWNMSIIFTEEIVGVQPDNKSFYKFNSRDYVGFLSYIQQQAPTLKKLGVIHYTNNSPANVYAEELFYNIDDETKRPTLDIPLVMWYKSTGATLGLRLRASGVKKTLFREVSPQIDQKPTSLNTTYYDLTDPNGYVVGKVFTDLKLFVIEDQELLFAMSYKSNRSWTLPNYGVDINANITFGCPTCQLTYSVTGVSPTITGGDDGMLHIFNIENYIGDPTLGQLILEVRSGTTQMYFDRITGETYVSGLTEGSNYDVYISDLGSKDCTIYRNGSITIPNSNLNIYDMELTQAILNPDFIINRVNPTTIRIVNENLGTFIGSGYTAIVLKGTTPQLSDFHRIGETPTSYYEDNTLTFQETYTVFVRDVTGGTVNDFISTGYSSNATVWKDYVAVGTPFKSNFIIVSSVDANGTFITVTDFLTTINPAINPIIGGIEFCLYKTNSVPLNWQISNKIYFTENTEYFVEIRERVGTAIAAEVIKHVDLT